MSFLDSFDISASGLSAQRVRMDVAAENIANANTTRTESGGAYRRKDVVLESFGTSQTFQSILNEKAKNGSNIRRTSVKSGVRVSEIVDDPTELKKVYNPSHPDADENGYVEMPNVDILKETVDTMDATRSYEANVTVLNALKQMTQKAMEIK